MSYDTLSAMSSANSPGSSGKRFPRARFRLKPLVRKFVHAHYTCPS
jgi:hypothetical protein